MTGISSSVGLISGIDYTSLVAQLMEVEKLPYTYLENRTNKLITEESTWTNLTAKFLTANYMVSNLNKADVYKRCEVSSSNDSILVASGKAAGVEGVYTFTPIQTASAQQTMAQGVASETNPLGKSGTISIGRGWSLENDVYLADINGGEGFDKGYIRITDGSGAKATIDLRQCLTMNDVIETINKNQTADIWAEMDGDQLVISDLSGGGEGVKIQEVSKGSTAASLGFDTSNSTGTDSITGNSLYRLGEKTNLNILNDGNGIVFDEYTTDLVITAKDGTIINVDFSETYTTGTGKEAVTQNKREQTLGDLINTINSAEKNDGKIVASISDDGKRLVITDTTVKKIKGGLVDGSDPAEYELPAEYDPADYELDESGFIMYKTGPKAGQYVGDASQETTVSQTTQARMAPVLQSLGFLNYNDSYTNGISFSGDSITSRDLLGDMDSTLVASLQGGRGVADAKEGSMEIQDRAGNKTTISLSKEELKTVQSGTLNEAIGLLNQKIETAQWKNSAGDDIAYGKNVGVKIELNDTKTGLNVVDKTGRSSHNLIFQDVESSQQKLDEDGDPMFDEESGDPIMETTDPGIAKSLGLNIGSVASSTGNGSSLNFQTVSYNTKLSEMNGGKGITVLNGSIKITDSSGATATLKIDSTKHTTIGSLINDINTMQGTGSGQARILARLNANGDGIEILDLANGTGSLTVDDGSTTSKICKELGLVQTVTQEDKAKNGGVMLASGSSTYKVEVKEEDSLEDIRKKISDLGGNFSASIVQDGSGTPYRLVITGGTTGEAGSMNIDLSALGLSTQNITEAQDAVLVYGDNASNTGITVRSSSNVFKNVVNGIDLTVKGVSDTPITVSSVSSSADIKASISAFVENYNAFREQYNTDTFYSPAVEAGNTLYNSSLAKRFGADIQSALLTPMYDITGINSIQSLGVSVRSSIDDDGINKETGKLVFDEDVFDAIWETNPEGVQEFFFRQQTTLDPSGELDDDGNPKTITQSVGWAQKFLDVADQYTGKDSGKIYKELATLDTKITDNEERLGFLQGRLETKQQQLLNKFYRMETAMAKMSSDMNSISSISSNWSSNYSASGSLSGY